MPNYDYECDVCETIRHTQHSIKEDPIVLCFSCGEPMYRVVTGGTGVIFVENDGPISAKPDSYFANAEWNKKRRLRREADDTNEKIHYKDKQTDIKIEGLKERAEVRNQIEKQE